MPYAPQGNTLKHMKFEEPPALKAEGNQLKLSGYNYTCKIIKNIHKGQGLIEFQR